MAKVPQRVKSVPTVSPSPPGRLAEKPGSARGSRRDAIVSRAVSIDPAIVALAVLGLVLAFHRLGAKSIVLDETTSVAYAKLGLGDLRHVLSGGDPNMGLYYVLLHPWVALFGDGEAAARSLSAAVTLYRVRDAAGRRSARAARASG